MEKLFKKVLYMTNDPDLTLLSNIRTTLDANPGAKQREIAAGMGLSLGMTNAVLRRFANKGWIMSKKISARNIRYILTPDGMNELAHRSYNYVRRTFKEVRDCGTAVEQRIMQAKEQGCTKVLLYGESDIAFIIEWACRRAGVEFVQMSVPEKWTSPPDGGLGIVGETVDPALMEKLRAQGWNSVYDTAAAGTGAIQR